MPELSVVIAERIEVPAAQIWTPTSAWVSAAGTVGNIVERDFELDPRFLLQTKVVARLDEVNAEDRFMRYELVDCGELPVTDCRIAIRITPMGPSACAYKFEAKFYSVEQTDDVVRTMLASHGVQLLAAAKVAAGIA